MIKKMISTFALSICLTILAYASGVEVHKSVELHRSGAEMEREHQGRVDIDRKGEKERFKVSVSTKAPVGSTFMVYADDRLVGHLTVDDFGRGEFERRNDDNKPLPTALKNITAIKGVQVKNEDGIIIMKVDF